MTLLSTPKEKITHILLALFISLFGTIFLWNFWDHGLNVLGLNSLMYCFLFIGFFVYLKRGILSKKSLAWLIPLSLISLSMGIYTNDFTKGISLFLLPWMFLIFTTHEAQKEVRPTLWSRFIFLEVIFSVANYLTSVFQAFGLFKFKKKERSTSYFSPEKKNLAIQIGLGVLILIILAGIIIIPLLSSADTQFGSLFEGIMQFLSRIGDYIWSAIEYIFGANFFYRLVVTVIGMMLLLGYGLYWNAKHKESQLLEKESDYGQKYSVTISIILVGVLVLYLIFIVLQLKTLFVGALPVKFEETEYLVKTGFWQLFLLTLINILFYIGLYQKSTKIVQTILGVFTFASLLLIISAAHRTYLYVTNYGLSYEKFYAFYTVIFCIGVFAWFLYLFVGKKQKPEIIKNLAFASLWMYALTTIVPLEKIIFTTNLGLTQKEDSRVNINELQMLGFDVLPTVEKHFDQLVTEAEKDYAEQVAQWIKDGQGQVPEEAKREWLAQDMGKDWEMWMEQVKEKSENLNYYEYHYEDSGFDYPMNTEKPKAKRWYEKTISELIY